MYKAKSFTLVIFVFFAASVVSAQEWTQWRGPARDGFVAGEKCACRVA